MAALTAFVRRHAGVAPPVGYVDLLRVANGLDADGRTVLLHHVLRSVTG